MAYITNDGARLIERARTEGRFIVFGSVRMNTTYKSDPTSLVQKTEEWYGENHGSVVGCISHVSVNGVSEVCDSKLAVQCNDNNESWKSIGIYAHLDGEDEVLLACESIENGEYKDVTIVELPVTLDGVVEDFGLSEGGSGGGGGGGEVPANMMTTDTEQTGLTGTKTWTWENYSGSGSLDNPQEGDTRVNESLSIDGLVGVGIHAPLTIDSNVSKYGSKEGWYESEYRRLRITSYEVSFNDSSASWSSIIKAARVEQGFNRANIRQMEDGSMEINGVQVAPNHEIKIGAYTLLSIDSNGKIASLRANSGGNVLDVSVAVFDTGSVHRVSGIVNEVAGLSFDSPITPAEGQEIYIHWTRVDNT